MWSSHGHQPENAALQQRQQLVLQLLPLGLSLGHCTGFRTETNTEDWRGRCSLEGDAFHLPQIGVESQAAGWLCEELQLLSRGFKNHRTGRLKSSATLGRCKSPAKHWSRTVHLVHAVYLPKDVAMHKHLRPVWHPATGQCQACSLP